MPQLKLQSVLLSAFVRAQIYVASQFFKRVWKRPSTSLCVCVCVYEGVNSVLGRFVCMCVRGVWGRFVYVCVCFALWGRGTEEEEGEGKKKNDQAAVEHLTPANGTSGRNAGWLPLEHSYICGTHAPFSSPVLSPPPSPCCAPRPTMIQSDSAFASQCSV